MIILYFDGGKDRRGMIMKKYLRFIVLGLVVCGLAACAGGPYPRGAAGILVFQSDFSLKDGAVSAMKGVAIGVDRNLKIYDLTHEIPAYSIWDAAYRFYQTAEYWPAGTVFVSVVDPGVGTDRLSVVLKTRTGQYFVTPDNGTLTLVAEKFGIAEVRQIDEVVNRRLDSEKSYTFHGRDVYAYTGARLASGAISFEQVGKALPPRVESISYQKAAFENGALFGNIPILDVQYGNVWTNIDRAAAAGMNIQTGSVYTVEIFNKGVPVFKGEMPFCNSFGDVPEGENLMYYNSLDSLSFAINMGDFASTYGVEYGGDWSVKVSGPAP
ncbi:MAG: S-adenosyl-l-methionine hydroxide adenosyltransferase family protein [Treponema sp.]|jgi:S-adenosylmethionine hydrolase|nr:S-adenosyl-l-methionine hydroxide adenosyltransferase family protein [Treponema sp.]